MDINEALILIERYVEAVEDTDLSSAYDDAARTLFTFLREYGCNNRQIGEACNIIEAATGYHPSQIRTLDDAETVKAALYGCLNSDALGRRLQPDQTRDSARWAIDNTRFGFGEAPDPMEPDPMEEE